MSQVDSGMAFYSFVVVVVSAVVHLVYVLVFKEHRKNGHYTLPCRCKDQ